MSDEFGLRSSPRDRARRIDGGGSGAVAWFSPRLIVGLAIVVLGSLLLLDNLGKAAEQQSQNVHAALSEAEWITLMFFLGLFVRRTRERDAFAGFAAGLAAMVAVIAWTTIDYTWHTLIGCLATLAVGTLASYVRPASSVGR